MPISRPYLPILLLLLLPLTACDQIGALDGSKAREADGVAVGSACRQAGRAIEDCFTMNPDALKASVFAGWKEMNDYMVQNKLETVKPEIPRPAAREMAKDVSKKSGDRAEAGDGHAAPGAAPAMKTAIAIPDVSPFSPETPAPAAGRIAVAPATAPVARMPVAPAVAPAAAPAVPEGRSGAMPIAPGSASLVIPGVPPVSIVMPGTAPGVPAIARAAPPSR